MPLQNTFELTSLFGPLPRTSGSPTLPSKAGFLVPRLIRMHQNCSSPLVEYKKIVLPNGYLPKRSLRSHQLTAKSRSSEAVSSSPKEPLIQLLGRLGSDV